MSEINPGIRRTVALLNANGYETCDSGDGETRDFECDRDDPYVVVKLFVGSVGDSFIYRTRRLLKLLTDQGIQVHEVGMGLPCIQASYDPVNNVGVIDITGIHDRMLPKEA